MTKRPNILFAIADDASHFGAYGHSFVKTPVCDYLAENGLLFQNAFTSNPKCAPSRASILTGKFTWELEEACNHFSLFPAKFPVFPQVMEDNGYHVGFTGKGWGPGDFLTGGFKRNPAGVEYNKYHLTPPEGSCISDCDYESNFKDFLSEKPADAPFYFWYGCREPHRKYSYGEGLRGGKSLDEIKSVPTYWPDDERVRVDMLDYAYEIEWFDKNLGKLIDVLKEAGELDNTLIVVTSDNGCPFPRVKGQMYEQDFHLPMIAYWKNNIAPGRVTDDLVSFTDLAPTFLEAVGLDAPSSMTGKSFLNVLRAPQSGQIDPSREVTYFGREKHDLGRENDYGYPVRCIRDYQYLYIRNFAPERWPAGNPETGFTNCDSSPTKTLVLELDKQGEHKYFDWAFGKRPGEELYNIVADPECLNNLASDEHFADVKAKLWGRLSAFLHETNDPRILGNGDIFESYPYVGKAPHSWKNYINGTFKRQEF